MFGFLANSRVWQFTVVGPVNVLAWGPESRTVPPPKKLDTKFSPPDPEMMPLKSRAKPEVETGAATFSVESRTTGPAQVDWPPAIKKEFPWDSVSTNKGTPPM